MKTFPSVNLRKYGYKRNKNTKLGGVIPLTYILLFYISIHTERCTRWSSWLRHCTASRKIAGSILGGVIKIVHFLNPSSRTMALVLTQTPMRNKYQESSLGVKAVGV